MPNRILKESVCSSDKISSLTDFEYRLWTGLILMADDAGRGDARAAIIKGRVFPLRDRVTVKDIDVALHGLAGKGCVSLYNVDGKPYFYFPTWTEHQRVRDVKPKYPDPAECDPDFDNSPRIAADCRNSPQIAADCGLNPIQSNPNPNPNTKRECADKPHRFTPPTVEEITKYCKERGNGVDPEQFHDFYSAKGWKVGDQSMRDWKAAVRTWERRDDKKPKQGAYAPTSAMTTGKTPGKPTREELERMKKALEGM